MCALGRPSQQWGRGFFQNTNRVVCRMHNLFHTNNPSPLVDRNDAIFPTQPCILVGGASVTRRSSGTHDLYFCFSSLHQSKQYLVALVPVLPLHIMRIASHLLALLQDLREGPYSSETVELLQQEKNKQNARRQAQGEMGFRVIREAQKNNRGKEKRTNQSKDSQK